MVQIISEKTIRSFLLSPYKIKVQRLIIFNLRVSISLECLRTRLDEPSRSSIWVSWAWCVLCWTDLQTWTWLDRTSTNQSGKTCDLLLKTQDWWRSSVRRLIRSAVLIGPLQSKSQENVSGRGGGRRSEAFEEKLNTSSQHKLLMKNRRDPTVQHENKYYKNMRSRELWQTDREAVWERELRVKPIRHLPLYWQPSASWLPLRSAWLSSWRRGRTPWGSPR